MTKRLLENSASENDILFQILVMIITLSKIKMFLRHSACTLVLLVIESIRIRFEIMYQLYAIYHLIQVMFILFVLNKVQ